MKSWKRAYLYVCRKKGKSLLLSVTVFLLSTFSVAGLLLRDMTDLAAAQTRQSLRGAFRIAPDMSSGRNVEVSVENGQTGIRYIGEPLDEKVIAAVKGRQRIEAYNAVLKENARLQEEISLVDYSGNFQDDPVAMHTISVEADTESIYAGDFQEERLRLTEGEPIMAEDNYAAVIGKKLASQNHLEIGDEIRLSPCEGHGGQEIRVTIKGLFEVVEKQWDRGEAAPVNLLENRIFIDITSACLLTNAEGADYMEFFVEDPAQVAAIIEDIQKVEDINWESFGIRADIGEYEKIANPLLSMSILSDTLLTVTGIMSTAVLSLIQILFHKAREHEMGILLSAGISKAEILLQHLMELLMTALPSFLLSLAVCFAAGRGIRKIIYNMAAYGGEINFNPVFVLKTAATAFGWGSAVLFLSVLFSNVWLMRLCPRKIFSRLS